MKRCPECYEVYDDDGRFCETDGHELLADPAYSPKTEVVVVNASAGRSWWPAAALGIFIGIIVGAGVFAVAMLVSRPETNESPARSRATEVSERAVPNRAIAVSNSVPTPEPEMSPSPDSEAEPEAEPSPVTNTETKAASVLNEGPISTGRKIEPGEVTGQTVIEMNDGSTLDVDAAWEDKQGIWYRRSGLVSFVDSSRVKAITARRETKTSETPHR